MKHFEVKLRLTNGIDVTTESVIGGTTEASQFTWGPDRGAVRRVVNSTYLSLDGLTEQLQDWHFKYHDDEADEVALAGLRASDAVLMGRKTYESFAAVWPTQVGAFAERINTLPKYVASTTLTEPQWDNTAVVEGDLAAYVATLKQRPGKDIMSYGFGPVARTLLTHGLLDEIHIWLHPVFSGSATPLDLIFRDSDQVSLDLVDHRALASGIVILSYRPAPPAA
jgi:dihydrofolate reductase